MPLDESSKLCKLATRRLVMASRVSDYQERRALGICYRCQQPVVHGTVTCQKHLELKRVQQRKYIAKKLGPRKGTSLGGRPRVDGTANENRK